MNIFVLDPDPVIAASYHCDQHLHKMILESAQMLSTCADYFGHISPHIYKPSYQTHPCNHWIKQSPRHAAWVYTLAKELEEIRLSLDCPFHGSMNVIKACADLMELEDYSNKPDQFIFCGLDRIRLRPDLTVPQKYQEYYKSKYRQWLDTKAPMSYKGRPLPPFLQEFSESIQHG